MHMPGVFHLRRNRQYNQLPHMVYCVLSKMTVLVTSIVVVRVHIQWQGLQSDPAS